MTEKIGGPGGTRTRGPRLANHKSRLQRVGVCTQLLRQSESKVFKKYSQMKLRMQREALEKMNRQANEMNAEGTTAVQEPGSLCTVPAHF